MRRCLTPKETQYRASLTKEIIKMGVDLQHKVLRNVIQEEIDRCKVLQAYFAKRGPSGLMIMALIGTDIQGAEKAIEAGDNTAMFHALRALRENVKTH